MMAVTPEEQEVVSLLGEAWNAFLKLPKEHPDEHSEFRHAIHTAQNMILARSGTRELNVSGVTKWS